MTHEHYNNPGYGIQQPFQQPIQQEFIQAPGVAQSTADLSNLGFFEPILVFAAVFVILFALLMKTKLLGEQAHPWFNVLISFVFATIFTLSVSLREVVLISIPWFAVLLVALFLILVLVGLMGKTDDIVGKGLGWVFIILIALVFVFATAFVYFDDALPYLPGVNFGVGGEPELLFFFDWFYSANIFGTISFIVVAGVIGWILIKFPKIKDD